MALERRANDLDDYFIISEELQLFDQLISGDLDLPSNVPRASPEHDDCYENESLNHTIASECNGEMDSALFSEVDENKENIPPNSNPYSELKIENVSEPFKSLGGFWNNGDDVKQPAVLPMSVKAESDDGSDSSLNPWICRFCKKTFKYQYTLNRHLPTHTEERNFPCGICGKAFRQMSTLSQHRAIHSNARPYICTVCAKTFNRISTLISHKKTHTQDKPHKCTFCGKAFHQKGNLRNHIFTHTNERPYKCDICGKGFNQMSNLVCHRKTVADCRKPWLFQTHYHDTKDGCYRCRRCLQVFDNRSSLYFHEEIVHGARNRSRLASGYISSEINGSSEYPNLNEWKLTIDAINTRRMEETLRRGLIPFALLQTCNGHSIPVKLVPSPDEKLFVFPAAAHEITQYSHCGPNKVQIKLPMVAKIMQIYNEAGRFQIKVEPIIDDDNSYDNIGHDTDPVNQEGEENVKLLSLN